MLLKAYLTLDPRTSGSRWVITLSWLSESLRSFLYSSSVYSCHLLLISSIISVLYCVHLYMKYSFGISDFLKEISSLSHSIVFLYFFVLITEEGFLISPCYPLELCIQMGISFFPPLPFASLLFTAICKASSDKHFAFLHFFFFGKQCHEPPSTVLWALCLSDLIPWIYLSLPLYNRKGFDLGHTWIVTLLICRVHHEKCWAGGSTSWNQDSLEKYQ